MTNPAPVTFFYPYEDELRQLGAICLDEPTFWSHEGKSRRRAWILQTYLWLRRFGYDVRISATLPVEGLVVLLPEAPILEAFHAQYATAHRALLIVTIRADILGYRSLVGDVDITQNGRFADETRTFFVPHWLQPGLRPRAADRGTTIENVVFKGGFGSLLEEFRSPEWRAGLDRRGLHFHIASAATEGDIPTWYDYETADLNLAVRPSFGDGGLRCEKPASKLVNAWHAGVPSLLGREYAFRELRESELDYLEVTTVSEALAAIDRLLESPSLYRRMVRRARHRALDFTPRKIAERWAEVLFEKAPRIAHRRSFQWSRSLPLGPRRAVNFAFAPPTPYELRKRVGQALRAVRVDRSNAR